MQEVQRHRNCITKSLRACLSKHKILNLAFESHTMPVGMLTVLSAQDSNLVAVSRPAPQLEQLLQCKQLAAGADVRQAKKGAVNSETA